MQISSSNITGNASSGFNITKSVIDTAMANLPSNFTVRSIKVFVDMDGTFNTSNDPSSESYGFSWTPPLIVAINSVLDIDNGQYGNQPGIDIALTNISDSDANSATWVFKVVGGSSDGNTASYSGGLTFSQGHAAKALSNITLPNDATGLSVSMTPSGGGTTITSVNYTIPVLNSSPLIGVSYNDTNGMAITVSSSDVSVSSAAANNIMVRVYDPSGSSDTLQINSSDIIGNAANGFTISKSVIDAALQKAEIKLKQLKII